MKILKPYNSAEYSRGAVISSLTGIVLLLWSSTTTLVDSSDLSYGDFAPIGCKEEVSDCKPWSSLFGLNNSVLVEIACNDCVTLGEFIKDGDNEPTAINLNKGLDIHGTLYIPPNTTVIISTPFVTVQGRLVIHSEAEVDGQEDVKFILTGTQDHILIPTLVGRKNNTKACVANARMPDEVACNIGKKAFAVPGGSVDIRALPEECPIWVNLMDNVLSPKPIVTMDALNLSPPEGCPISIFNEDFNNGDLNGWTSSLGTEFRVLHPDDELPSASPTGSPTIIELQERYLQRSNETDFIEDQDENERDENVVKKVFKEGHDGTNFFQSTLRKADFQGPGVDFRKLGLAKCILPNTKYLFRMTARLTNTTRLTSNCYESGKDCLLVKINTLTKDLVSQWKTVYYMPPGAAVPDGDWFTVVGYIDFLDIIDTTALFQNFYVCGPEPGIDIAIDDIELSLPQLDFPNKEEVCNKMVSNGDAELGGHPHPIQIYANPEAFLSIGVEEDGNKFFKVKGRRETWAGLQVPLNLECVEKFVVYRYTARIWLQSETEERVTFALKYSKPDGSAGFKVRPFGTCLPTSKYTGWTTCSQPFMFTEEYENVTFADFFFRSENEENDLWVDDLAIGLENTPVQGLVVPKSVVGCWGVGAQILTTSHTLSWKDAVVTEITNITMEGDYALLTLNDTMQWHTTYKQSRLTAVEVCLLSRNVLIIGADDDVANEKHGGHFIILQSPGVVQVVEGVEFRRMGQQGNMGKYPIHYHLGQNSPGSILAKNTIRDSFQRCLVIHNTHNVTISWNIAYDTFGHCFMTEDGIEQDNLFEFNLGANTHIMPDEGVLSIAESDMFASTFWISSPTNMFLNNVAAGSEDTGFWYEMLELVRGVSTYWDKNFTRNPSKAEYGFNIGTVCHSNKGDGFKLYPNGYFPDEEASFRNFRSYLNKGDGVLLHNSANLAIDGGYFADNRQGVEVDKQADAVRVSNGRFVGFSQLFMDISTASVTATHCPANRPLVGVQLHSFLRTRDSRGYLVEGNTFERFGESVTQCKGSSAMNIDPQVRDTPPHYDAYATLRNNTYEEGIPMSEKFDACKIENSGVIDMAIYDQTGDLNPVSKGTPGFVVSNHSIMTKFSPKTCHNMMGSCALYCEEICYRTVNVATPADEQLINIRLRATRTDDGEYVDFGSYFEYFDEDGVVEHTVNGRTRFKKVKVNSTNDNFYHTRRRYFSAILPHGNYELQFYKDNVTTYPKFIELIFDDAPLCSPYIDNTTIVFLTPNATEGTCQQLIGNGGVETGTFESWQHGGGSMKVINQGYLSSKAMRTLERTGSWHGIGQYLDTRCMIEGQQYEVTARYRLLNEGDNFITCDVLMKEYSNPVVCPRISIRLRHLTGDSIGSKVINKYLYPIAEALAPVKANEWNFMYGVMTVTAEMANATTAFMWVERYGVGKNMFLDSFSAIPVVRTCEDADFNRGVENGDLSWWKTFGQTVMNLVEPGYDGSSYAIKSTRRKQFWSSQASIIKPECLEAGKAFKISAKFKLMRGNNAWDCIPGRYWGPLAFQHEVCPTLSIRADKGGVRMVRDLGVVTVYKKDEWNDIFGVFMVSEDMATADSAFAWFTKFHPMTDLIIDNFSIQLEAGVGCDQNILHNGDLNYGDTRSWSVFFAGKLETFEYTDSDGEPNYAAAYINSKYLHEGAGQRMERLCLDHETEFIASADVKLFEADKITPYLCDATLKKNPSRAQMESKTVAVRCPVIAIATQNPGTFPKFMEIGAIDGTWVMEDWNRLEGTFRLTIEQMESKKMWIEVHNTKPGLTIVIDNFTLKRIITGAPTTSPTFMYEEEIVTNNSTYTEGKFVGPNMGSNSNADFADAGGNWTFYPIENLTEATYSPDEVENEEVENEEVEYVR